MWAELLSLKLTMQLVEVFLCTETTHSLSLTIEDVEEENKWWKRDTDEWIHCQREYDKQSNDQQTEQ